MTMSMPLFDQNPTPTTTMAARVARYFRERPGQWVAGRTIATFAGMYAWRTRISDIRRAPYFMQIQNRQRRVLRDDGTPFTISEYRFITKDMTPC